MKTLKFAADTTVYGTCDACGSDMLPDVFPTHPALPGFAGYPAGTIVDGEVWVRCARGCCGGWRSAPQQAEAA